MIKELIKLATHLDERGLAKEADYLDSIIKKASSEFALELDRDDMIPFMDDVSSEDVVTQRPDGYSSPESRMLNLIHAGEELGLRLSPAPDGGWTEATLKAELQSSLDLKDISSDDMDKVLNLAIKLVANGPGGGPQHIAATPRVSYRD
jgi:hypothetical protein